METSKKPFSLLNLFRKIGASLFFIGYIPPASGTIGSALTVLGIWFVHAKYPVFFDIQHLVWYWGAAIALIAISIVLSSNAKNVFGKDDPSAVIIDEVAGQFITFFMIPISLYTLIAGFVLFRFYDIVKPFPVNKMEEMDDGVGITMDDIAAGVYANITILVLMACYHWVKGYL